MMNDLFYEKQHWQAGKNRVAGVDEAGRGPLAGPVVAAAVILPKGFRIDDIKDSKCLAEKKREKFFTLIEEKAMSYGIGIVSEKVIDEINILQATFLAMKTAVEQLHCMPDVLIIDGNQSVPDIEIEQMPIVKGDTKSISIAAASILAKVTRDRLMMGYDKKYPLYGFAKHKGYPTRAHCEAIHQYGYCEIHRRSFHVRSI